MIEVGDRVTYKDKYGTERTVIIKDEEMAILYKTDKKYIKILKIERPEWKVIEEKKELLTEEEREFLKELIEKHSIQDIKEIFVGDFVNIRTNAGEKFMLAYKDKNIKFHLLNYCQAYTLKELGLEEK